MRKKLILLISSSIVTLLVVELVLRVFQPFNFRVKGNKIVLPTNQSTVFQLPPGKKLDRYVTFSRNSLGFRGEDPPIDLSEHLTLITVGGSTTESIVLDDNDTWTAHLGRKLQSSFDKVWVNNAGLDGHSTYGHLILMKDYISSIKPKYALFLLGVNDVAREEPGHSDKKLVRRNVEDYSKFVLQSAKHFELASLILNLVQLQGAEESGLVHREVDFLAWRNEKTDAKTGLLGESETNYQILGISTTIAEDLEEVLPHYQPALIKFESRIRELITLTRGFNIEPVLATQPAVYGYGIDPSTGIDFSRIIIPKGPWNWDGGMSGYAAWSVLESYNDVTRKVGQEEGVLVIDIAHEMPNDTKYYYDFIHFTTEGAEYVAEIIYGYLCPYIAERDKEHQIRGCI